MTQQKQNKIPIHWLHSQAYCEYQIYLEHVLGKEGKITSEMEKGKKVHSMLEEKHKEKAEIKLSVKDALEKSQKEKIILVGREVYVENENLMGLIDEIHFTPNKIIIINDKPGDFAYLTNKMQVWGYCLAFQEQFNPKISIVGCIRQRDNQKILWKGDFLDEHKNMVLDAIKRILGIINGNQKPQPTTKISKCKNYRLKDDCDKCLK